MKLRELTSNLLNHSEFAGYNLLTISISLPAIAGMIYIGYLAYISENGFLTVFIGAIVLVLMVISINSLENQVTVMIMRTRLKKMKEEMLSYVFSSFVFNPDVNLKGVSFPNTNQFMIGVIMAYTSDNNIYFSPTISYTKQHVIKIPLSEIREVDMNTMTILRQTEQDAKDLNESAATTAGTTGVYLPVGEIQESLDRSLPLRRLDMEIKTNEASYRFLIHEKLIENLLVKKLTEMVKLTA